ncbi:S9 family peptidase [Terrimonas pollutisoli]|uniref:S9 family peptidase n=1 Tax=Terrimonas pollutisoli TaxID=3034147 RepID=UPI0023EC4F22|nr:prolyl oligopeptidase family serine peptidase [Terrimonas sp. H1YJ31]
MTKKACTVIFIVAITSSHAQQKPDKLTVEKIMRDPKWIGTSPSSPQWSADGKTIFFNWNPDKAIADSLYYITLENKVPVKASVFQKQALLTANSLVYNKNRTAYAYTKDGDVFYTDIKLAKTKRITETTDNESNPQFSFNDRKVIYNRSQNLYAWNIATGETQQLTNLKSGTAGQSGGAATRGVATSSRTSTEILSQQETWLKRDQLQYFEVLRSRKEKKDEAEKYTNATKPKELRSISIEDKILQGLAISPDGRFVSYRLSKPVSNQKTTIVPNFVTETGFTTDIPARTKVGAAEGSTEFFIYDRERDTVYAVKIDSIPGINDLPDYVKDYPKQLEERTKEPVARAVTVFGPYWSPNGTHAVVDLRSQDNKDRWLMTWDRSSNQLKLLDRQRDEAWIGGPGIFGNIGWTDENTLWFQSEATGYSHLYTINVVKAEKKALTAGNYEIQRAQLSNDKKYFYITTNEVHPGEQHFYRLTIASGKRERLTTQMGANQVSLSPDEKYLAILYSYSTKPWELYLQENKVGGKTEQITVKAQSEEFKTYAWKDPEVVTFPARDGANVYARLYRPTNPHSNKPAVLFVHGAGYLQNAHKWWSQYFREYMFNNLLADNGYYVLDVDYRGSAGYGRDWRTGIYRFMGGKDLSDHVDGVNWLVKKFGVDPKHVGLYGGSYGGFITLMGMFNEPNTFAAGAALRPVTDWANYNHPYTSNILNEPFTDSIAYRKSSPFYFAEGLKGDLLICHGMVDVNVHYQDAVKLAQRLIELGKDNWELASYPMEDHGFIEPSSWTDEYKRIFKLFERVLKSER